MRTQLVCCVHTQPINRLKGDDLNVAERRLSHLFYADRNSTQQAYRQSQLNFLPLPLHVK